MSPRPAIFISAVRRELRSARQLVANTLTFLGYDPEWQDIFGTEEGDLRAMLRRRIDHCKGVVQLVGECYGAEPPVIDEQFGRVSYTQYEALYAGSRGKKVWYLFLDKAFPTDPHEAEVEEKRKLQADYRAKLEANSHLYHPLGSTEGLEASVLKLRDDLTRLRRGVKRWAAMVAVLLVLSVALSIWVLESEQHSHEQQRQTNDQLQTLQAKFEKLQLGVDSFVEVQNKVRQEQPGQKPDQVEQRTYEELAKQLGIDAATLKEQLPRFAQELKKAPNATTYERANAAYVAKDYNEAERLALVAADQAQGFNPPKNAEAVKAFELAGWAAEKRIEYADALKRLRAAEEFTDRKRDPVEWSRVQFVIALVLDDQAQYRDAENVLCEVLKERERVLGHEHPDTILTRHKLALQLDYQGKNGEAETEYRAVLKLENKVLGSEHSVTLGTRNNLACLLSMQGKYADAEAEFRAILKIRERVLGAENPDTLATRNNLAIALRHEHKLGEAETEYRAVIKLEEKVLGPEHPQTLTSRSNLGTLLDDQGKYAEAETEDRAVIKLKDRLLAPEHPDTLETRTNLAEVLDHQAKYAEAETESRTVIMLEEKVLGPEHPQTLETRHNLAKALADEGKCSEAETEVRALIALRERVLGAEHPDTLETRVDLAKVLAKQGRYAEAEADDRAVLELQEKVLGTENPDTLSTYFELAVCLRSEGHVEEASTFAQRAADGAGKVLGKDHPDTKKYDQLRQELLAKND
jgi:tetratricopeptide (TPR) repeat protein